MRFFSSIHNIEGLIIALYVVSKSLILVARSITKSLSEFQEEISPQKLVIAGVKTDVSGLDAG